MSTLTDRPGTALLVVDVQNDVMDGSYNRDPVVANVGALVDKARASGTPVVWVQHSADDELVRGTPGWAYVPELVRAEGEPLVHKRYGDSFEDTELEQVLAGLGVGSLVVAGAQTDWCIRSTLHGALARGYDAALVADAHTTDLTTPAGVSGEDVVKHTNMYWGWHQAPGRTAGTLETADAFAT
ncbi:MAG: isochorismatase [Nocardioidaceae bacterium]|nr:isochorismatase [Nocardioidaceae bacterium]